MPAVVLTGARQTGKSTLVRARHPARRYLTLDDLDVQAAAGRDPEAIDERRTPGRFLLTGSANLLHMHRASESLAGRASYLTLWPMTRREQLGEARAGRWDELLGADETDWVDLLTSTADAPEDWRSLALRGGFPTPALDLPDASARRIWFEAYVRTYLVRDLQALASITALPDFRRVMRAAALRLGQVLNQSDLARDVAVAQPTVHRWLNLLEASYLLVRLPAYAVNRTKRLIKAPKVYWGDTGVALHLAGLGAPLGAHLENLVLHDLLAWRDARSDRARLHYWRTTTGEEVDLVVDVAGRLLPIEIKSTERPRLGDAKALRSFRAEYGEIARSGLLLHTGPHTEWLAPDVLAVPWWRVL